MLPSDLGKDVSDPSTSQQDQIPDSDTDLGAKKEDSTENSIPSPIPVKRTEDDQSGLSDFDPEGAFDQDSILDEKEFQKSDPVNYPTDTNEGGPQASSSAGASSLQDPPEDLTAETDKNNEEKSPMGPPAPLSQSSKTKAPKKSPLEARSRA